MHILLLLYIYTHIDKFYIILYSYSYHYYIILLYYSTIMSAAVAAPRPMFALDITKCVLRLISNCRMSLPVLYLSRFNEATTLNRNYHLSLYFPPPLPSASCIHLHSVANFYRFLYHIISHMFISFCIPPPFPRPSYPRYHRVSKRE